MKMNSLFALTVLLAGCTQQQANDTLERFPYGLAKGACKSSSKCTFEQEPSSRGGAEPAPGHWYEDGYGRDERAPHH